MSEPEIPHFYPDRGAGRSAPTIVLTGADLTVADVEAVARHGTSVALDVHARERMQEAREVIVGLVAEGAVVYGVTTGFGALASTSIPPADAPRLQEHLLMSHAAGVGPALPREVVRAMLLLRANTLALGHSGCRPLLVDRLLAFLDAGIHPVVPEQGSVGASGDLAPLAHLALPLIGRGQVEFNGSLVPALIALRETGLEPLALEPKEGLALLNGTQMMSAIGALVLADADRLGRTASVAAAMSIEALLGTDVAFAAAYQLARPHPGQVAVAAELRHLLRDSGLQAGHHDDDHKVQDPYSLRCVPQVHGAVRDALDHLRRVLDIELNSATDNPLVFPGGGVADASALATGGGRVISGGNFHGEPVALALDFAKLALAELGAISERRTALLLDPRLNGGLPPFLATASGIDSGMMIYQYTAAALASENKVLAHPASADSIPTSANQEDHVSMGSIAARHARAVTEHVERILAIELLVAAQALDLRLAMSGGQAPGAGVADASALATGGGRVISGGNFHGEPVALALDFAKLALAELGAISERRTALLLDPRLNGGLPPFLATASGIDSGMMIYQYTAAALASENKVLAHPASADSIPTSANQEDHVSMGSIAARHARAVTEHVERILAIELLVAAQALDLRLGMSGGRAPGAGVAEALARVRTRVHHLDGDREPGPDLAAATELVRRGELSDLAG